MALSKDQLRAGAQRYLSKVETVHLPTFADPKTGDDVVLVRGVSATEFDAHQASMRILTQSGEEIGIDQSNISAKLAVRVIVDTRGQRVLDDTDAGWFGEGSPADVAEVVNKALSLAGMAPDGTPTDDALGNSDATQDGEASSGSQKSTEPLPSSSSDDSTTAAD